MSQITENNQIPDTIINDDDTIDIKQIISRLINNWPLFTISIIMCVTIAFLYGKYAPQDWHVASKILVEDQKNGSSAAGSGNLNSEISSLFNVKSSADNEVQILKSRSLITSVVKKMDLNVRTYYVNGFKSIEIFDDAPFIVNVNFKSDTIAYRRFKINIVDKDNFKLVNADENIDINARFDSPIKLQQYTITLQKVKEPKPSLEYAIGIESVDAAITNFSQIFTAGLSDKQSTTIDLGFSYPNPKKGEAILNALMQQYLESNLQNRVQIADSTMRYIDREIEAVGKQLTSVETGLEEYKIKNNIADLQEQSKSLVGSATDSYEKLSQQNTQLIVVTEMQRQLNDPNNKKQLPSGLVFNNTSDQSFGQSINTYNELLLAKENASLTYTESSPTMISYNTQLVNLRANILKTLDTYRKGLQVASNQLKMQTGNFTSQLKQIPQKQRIYLDFQRQQQLKQELYLYLLQKKEETAISKTSTISSSRIIDNAKSEFTPYKPKKSIIMLIGLLIGVITPGIYLFIIELLNIRIKTKADIEKVTRVPIIGEISHNDEEKSLVVANNSRTIISEQFRSLRTNLQYATDSSKSNVLLFTSSMSGEGKSFLSLNLGSALALTDKKVIFMELDLRKPKLSENIGVDNSNGFTNYIVSKSTDLNTIIKPTWFNENSFLISSGPIPPNPSELLISDKLESMIAELKKQYDYIIIDCAPIGLVTDALLLEKYADVTFYVLRQDYTYKSQLNIVNDLRLNKKVKNLYIVVNDIKAKSGGYASYGQGYGYGYGYGYGGYAEESKKTAKSWFKK